LVQLGLGVLLSYALMIGLAYIDGDRLRKRGYRATAAWWMILAPVFFILRTVRVGVRGLAPMITYFVVSFLIAGLAAFASAAIPAYLASHPAGATSLSAAAPTTSDTAPVLPPLTSQQRAAELSPAGMQATILVTYAKQGTNLKAVKCAPLKNQREGTTTTCAAKQSDGATVTLIEQVTTADQFNAFKQTGTK
jgi:hypothetical protein